MKWTPGDPSSNVEDRRGGGGGGGFPIRRLGLAGTLVLLVLSLLFRKNLFQLLGDGSTPGTDARSAPSADEDKLVSFVSFVLDDVQKTWAKTLPAQAHKPYSDAKLVLFTDSVRSGCGFAESAMGPFYCPPDRKVYVDLGFYRALRDKLGAPGDFAQAYVIAHELGHHVQNLLGTEAWMRQQQRNMSKEDASQMSVKMELQADCYAGIWAHSTEQRDILEKGDIEEGLGAAAAVGDDRLQRAATGNVNPERWTHGSSAMRVRWFKKGLETGQVSDCDTFSARSL